MVEEKDRSDRKDESGELYMWPSSSQVEQAHILPLLGGQEVNQWAGNAVLLKPTIHSTM